LNDRITWRTIVPERVAAPDVEGLRGSKRSINGETLATKRQKSSGIAVRVISILRRIMG
jgi:hypothetical protein